MILFDLHLQLINDINLSLLYNGSRYNDQTRLFSVSSKTSYNLSKRLDINDYQPATTITAVSGSFYWKVGMLLNKIMAELILLVLAPSPVLVKVLAIKANMLLWHCELRRIGRGCFRE